MSARAERWLHCRRCARRCGVGRGRACRLDQDPSQATPERGALLMLFAHEIAAARGRRSDADIDLSSAVLSRFPRPTYAAEARSWWEALSAGHRRPEPAIKIAALAGPCACMMPPASWTASSRHGQRGPAFPCWDYSKVASRLDRVGQPARPFYVHTLADSLATANARRQARQLSLQSQCVPVGRAQ